MQVLEERLVSAELVSERDLSRARTVGRRAGTRLPATLVRLGLVSEAALADLLSKLTGNPIFGADQLSLAEVPGLNMNYCRRASAIPIDVGGDVKLAMADPMDEDAARALAFAIEDVGPDICVATFSDVQSCIPQGPAPVEQISSRGGSENDDIERLLEGDSDAPVIRLVERLLTEAVGRRASDIHIEPMARFLVVRYRIDGRLLEVERFDDSVAGPLASRIKVLSGLDIAETRLPQDGRLRLAVRGRDVDVRVATSPTAWGESIVLRILGRQSVSLDLSAIGLSAHTYEPLKRALAKPHGIILVTGPTGSGKSTTLYAALNHLKRPDIKILTVEDPVEVLIDGINQVQVKPEIELSYAATLRAFLRQDPDILMIGEIRDHETAEIAMRAALTGHLVLSTLHTNSALGAFTRLSDVGIAPYLTASTVNVSMAQRLVRALCQKCKAGAGLIDHEAELFETYQFEPPTEIYSAVGCGSCRNSGYSGRKPVVELIEVDDTLRTLIRDGRAGEWKFDDPRRSLTGHGLALVIAGETSLDEIRTAVGIR